MSPGSLFVLLALPGAGLLLLMLVLGPGVLLVLGLFAVAVGIPVVGVRLFGPRTKRER